MKKVSKKYLVKIFATFLAIFNFWFACAIQPVLAASATNPCISDTKEAITLKAGTPITVSFIQNMSPETVSNGQSIDFRVAYDVKVNGKVVIAAGAMAKGMVTKAEKRKMFGKPALIEVQLKSVLAADDQLIPLTSMPMQRQGNDKKTIAWVCFGVSLLILWPLIFVPFLIKGDNVEVVTGTNMEATIAQTTQINLQTTQN